MIVIAVSKDQQTSRIARCGLSVFSDHQNLVLKGQRNRTRVGLGGVKIFFRSSHWRLPRGQQVSSGTCWKTALSKAVPSSRNYTGMPINFTNAAGADHGIQMLLSALDKTDHGTQMLLSNVKMFDHVIQMLLSALEKVDRGMQMLVSAPARGRNGPVSSDFAVVQGISPEFSSISVESKAVVTLKNVLSAV